MDDLLEQGIAAYKAGKRDEARKIFIALVKQEPNNERAWGWMYMVANNDQEKIHCMKEALRINPKNEKAMQLLSQITDKQPSFSASTQKNENVKQPVMSVGQDEKVPVLSMQGVQDVLEIYVDKLVITPVGFFALVNKGMKGAKTIPFYSISAIQLRKPGSFTNGYIQFTLSGGIESRGGILDATKDENTVMFAAKDIVVAERIKEYIEQQIQQMRKPIASNQSAVSLSGELEKLAELKNKGILTEEEFQSAKKRLIG